MSARIRLIIIDDHSIVRHGLRSILELEQGLEVVGEANDAPSAWQCCLVFSRILCCLT